MVTAGHHFHAAVIVDSDALVRVVDGVVVVASFVVVVVVVVSVVVVCIVRWNVVVVSQIR